MILMDGECPQCVLAGAISPLRLNDYDLMECERCHLQISLATPVTATIMRERGRGVFRVNYPGPPISMVGLALSGQAPTFPISDDHYFADRSELEEYLDRVVERKQQSG